MHKDHSARRATAYSCRARARRARLALVFSLVSGAALLLAACGGGGGGGGGGTAPKTKFVEVRDTVNDVKYLPIPQVTSYALAAIGAHRSGGNGVAKGQGVSVAVIDGEVDDGHPDISPAFSRNPFGNALGRNVVEGHNDIRPVAQRIRKPRPDIVETVSTENQRLARQNIDTALAHSISHGTHVSGIIAARNNGFGVVGVAPEARLVPVTLFRDRLRTQYNRYGLSGLNDSGLPEWNRQIAASVNYAVSRNVFAINNSWGYSWFDNEIQSSDNRAPGT